MYVFRALGVTSSPLRLGEIACLVTKQMCLLNWRLDLSFYNNFPLTISPSVTGRHWVLRR